MFGIDDMLIGSLIGAGGNILGGLLGGNAQEEATNRAIAEQRAARGEATNLLMPFINAGQSILPTLQNFIDPNQQGSGLNMLLSLIQPGANQNELLAQTPGYQFSLDQGNRAVRNALTARGLGGSAGAVAKGVANYTQGLASQTWKDVVDRMQSAFTSGAGAMQNFAGIGGNAATSLAGGILGSGNAMANNITGLGNAQAGMWTGIGNSLGNLGNSVSQAALLSRLTGGGGAGGGGSMYNPTGFTTNPWSPQGMFGGMQFAA